MKSLEILLSILDEARFSLRASMSRDRLTILSRYENEGDAFIGITLPYFAEWLEESLSLRRVATSIFARFRKRPKQKSVLPCFLQGLTSRVFDAKTGLLLEHPDVNAVFFIRQICTSGKRVFKVCDPERDRKAQEAYRSVDLSLRSVPDFPKDKADMLNFVCRRFMPLLEEGFMRAIDDESILPRHGPGATADKAWANQKYRGREFYKRWDTIFSWEELYGFSTVHQSNRESQEPRDELPVKVVSVPKTMKTSRIICVEPTAMQYAQQLTSARLISAIHAARLYKHLNFHDQRPNQEAARVGSVLGNLATLDLSEASDRVSSKLVSLVFRHSPTLLRHLNGCRSTRAVLRGETIHLRKYASMGSALTFPVEALCFLMICIAAVCDERRAFRRNGRPVSLRAFEECRKNILVFGDDLIVPTDSVVKVNEYLGSFGLKVNSKKSFSTGDFRESCGHDYFRGVLITPTYVRRDPPRSHKDSDKFVSWVQMSNRFYKAGLWHVASKVREFIDKMYKLPLVPDTCSGLGWHTFGQAAEVQYRRNRKVQSGEYCIKTLVPKSSSYSDVLEDYDRLLFFHLNRGEAEVCLSDPTRSPKRGSLKLRPRKVLPW